MSKELHLNKQQGFYSNVMKILKSFDQTSQINNLEMLTCHHITQHVTNMKNKYSLFWKHKLTNSPKLHFLSTFKSEFKIEEYLNQVNKPTYRRLLTQFCVSCHTLNIEQGRYLWSPFAKPRIPCGPPFAFDQHFLKHVFIDRK